MYIAQKRLKVGEGWREPGDPVPEAAHWRTLRVYLENGSLVIDPNHDRGLATSKPAPPAPAASPTSSEGVDDTSAPGDSEDEAKPKKRKYTRRSKARRVRRVRRPVKA